MKLFIIYFLFGLGLSVYWAAGQPPGNRNQDEWYKEQWPTQPYAFGYEIRDYSGNEQYRKEMSDGERVTGSYGYLGPDGLYRHVEYVADENGFRAKIRTSEPGTSNDNPSNVQIESNPIQGVSSAPPVSGAPIVPRVYNSLDVGGGGSNYNNPIRPQNIPPVNPNRSTYGNRQPDSIPRAPEPSHGFTPSLNRSDVNRGTDGSRSGSPNYNVPNVRDGPIGGDNSGGRDGGDRVLYDDIPDNIMPYRGAQPKRPVIKNSPPIVVPQNEFTDDNVPKFGPNPDISDPQSYTRKSLPRLPEPQSFANPTDPPYERNFDRSGRNRNTIFDDNRDPPIGGYEVTTKGGSPKGSPKSFGFIEATKDPLNAIKPINKFYDKRPSNVFYGDNEGQYEDDFRRRQDSDQRVPVVTGKPVFEGKETPQKVGGFVRSRFNATAPDIRGVKSIGGLPPTSPITPSIRESFNRTVNVSSFDANQDRRDGYDKRVRRPTKVFVTSGPISGFDDNRPAIKGNERPFGAIDAQQRHIDVDYDDKNIRDGQPIGDGVRGQPDRDRPPPPLDLVGMQIPPQSLDIKPYYGARHYQGQARDRSQEPSLSQRPYVTPTPVSPPYDPRLEQQNIDTSDEDLPEQRDDEFPVDPQRVQPQRPQVYQPLRPNGRPDRQPSPPPRRPDRPAYKPRTQSQQPQDRSFVEQQHIDVQPYQTQSSATISSPANTIPNIYKPIDNLDDNTKPDENEVKDEQKPNLNTPLSPSSYVVTPFSANHSIIQIKPIIVKRPDLYTVGPQLSQMEIPKFGTRLRTPEPPLEEVYEPIDEYIDDHNVDQPQDLNHNNNDKTYDNPNDYLNDNQNNVQIESTTQSGNSDDNPMAQPLVYENLDNVEYYYDDDVDSAAVPVDTRVDTTHEDNQSKSLVYTQTISESHRSDQKVDISSQKSSTNSSSPIEISHQMMNILNWHKYNQGTSS